MSEQTPPSPLAPVASILRQVLAWLGATTRPMRVLLYSTLGATLLLTGWLSFNSLHTSYVLFFI